MKKWNLTLLFRDQEIPLSIVSPMYLEPIENYREVNFVLQGQGRRRAFFFLLPDKTSDDPYRVMSPAEWTRPVRWDDNTMLFVPSLDDEAILAAMTYILDNGLENEAFESEKDVSWGDSDV